MTQNTAMDYSNHWTDQKKSYEEAVNYIIGRQQGFIKSFKTPWPKINDAGVDGLEWSSLTVLGGRPGTGKTLIKDQIVREAFENNKGQNIRVLEFSLEMVARASKVREFSSVLGKPYKYICSTGGENMMTDEDIETIKAHSRKSVDIHKAPIDIVQNPVTVDVFIAIIHQYLRQHASSIQVPDQHGNMTTVMQYAKTVITLDHSILLKMSKHHKNKTDMLYELGEALTYLKRLYPIAFIILSQLGRHVEEPARNENGKYGNYILETDIFGGDALLQHADMVIGLNRPALKNISLYGPEKYIIDSDDILVFHFLKVRTGDVRMSFFKAVFEKMSVESLDKEPQRQGFSDGGGLSTAHIDLNI